MNRKLINAVYVGDYKILLIYENNELRLNDFSYILSENMGDYETIKDEQVFKQFKILKDWNTIEWSNGFDISPEMLYEKSLPVELRVAS